MSRGLVDVYKSQAGEPGSDAAGDQGTVEG
jgi:hypothetical protein